MEKRTRRVESFKGVFGREINIVVLKLHKNSDSTNVKCQKNYYMPISKSRLRY
jgi:hypothetical protein